MIYRAATGAVMSIAVSALLLAGCAANDVSRRAVTIPHADKVRAIEAAAPDPLGRQLYRAPHAMNPSMMQELRERVPKFASLDHSGIMQHMRAMGPNYTWYVSPLDVSDEYGVLILAHGFREHGDRVLAERLQPIAREHPTAMAMGMSMMTSDHIQLALNNLAQAGARDIIVVPVVSTHFNTMLRQWDYIFGLQEHPEYATVPRIVPPADLHIVPPLDDHPLVGDTLLDYAREISTEPSREDVIIVAHGPVFAADNQAQLDMLGRVADYMNQRSDYASITVATLQDDAPPEVRQANVAELRERVAASNAAGHDVLIVTNLLGTRMVQSTLRRDLRGLDYRFNSKGLIEHDNFIRWVEQSVAEVAARLD